MALPQTISKHGGIKKLEEGPTTTTTNGALDTTDNTFADSSVSSLPVVPLMRNQPPPSSVVAEYSIDIPAASTPSHAIPIRQFSNHYRKDSYRSNISHAHTPKVCRQLVSWSSYIWHLNAHAEMTHVAAAGGIA